MRLEHRALHRLRHRQRPFELRHRFRQLLLGAIGVADVVVRGQHQHGVVREDLGRLGVVPANLRVVAGVLVDRADVVQRDRLAARLLRLAEDVIRTLEALQRRLHLALGGQ